MSAPSGRLSARYDSEFVILHRTSPANASPNGSGRRWLAAAGLTVVLTVFGGGIAGVATASPAQDPAITTTSGAFGTEPLGAADASTTTATTTSGTPAAEETTPTASGRSEEIAEENRRIALIVGGLIVVAVALLLLTIRYWRATRPVLAVADDVDGAERSQDDLAVDFDARSDDRRGRRSRRAVAGADHAGADEAWEPRATGEQPRIDLPSAVRTVRPSKQQRASALSREGE